MGIPFWAFRLCFSFEGRFFFCWYILVIFFLFWTQFPITNRDLIIIISHISAFLLWLILWKPRRIYFIFLNYVFGNIHLIYFDLIIRDSIVHLNIILTLIDRVLNIFRMVLWWLVKFLIGAFLATSSNFRHF